MSLQLIFILLTALAACAYLSALKKLLPSKGQQPLMACCGTQTPLNTLFFLSQAIKLQHVDGGTGREIDQSLMRGGDFGST